ncbi:tRNA lysidine(34) synthetase TilS [Labrenzia sp. 011]|uniref:tRNA lysidine(34) synthetase TilS n=1 Tax=Labrenzia sp. 011 TaxID=2171494 RepID=UPI0014024C6E|nr:tRNA lysidine(34) synthetase TilS [Labrenzia sp. 011]
MQNVPDGPVEHSTLPDEDVDFLFCRLKPFSRLALAVSGGADSSSLLVLFSEWMRRTSWQGEAEVLCVDHGLRPESAGEAEFVVALAADHGLPAAILRWEGQKPASNMQEEARQARYRLIAGHMRQSGAQALVLAHHRDDQAETFLDRLTRGSGLSGLGAMACDEPDGPQGLRLLRPLLSVPKARLEASLRVRGVAWCSDPSNLAPKYKRSRLRRIMALLAEEGLSASRIAETAEHLRRARDALETTLEALVEAHVSEHPAGPLKMSREIYRSTAKDLRLRLLSRLAARATGNRVRIRFRKLEALDAVLAGADDRRSSLAGALFDAKGDILRIWKEAGRAPPETCVLTAVPQIWDSRYRISSPADTECPDSADSLCLGPLCRAPVRARDIHWPADWPKEAFDCSPVVWTADGTIVASCLPADRPIGDCSPAMMFTMERIPGRGLPEAGYVNVGNRDEEI